MVDIHNSEEDRLEAMVGPPGVWKDCRDFQINFLRKMGLKTHHQVLDIGCGPLRGGIPLIRYLDAGNYFQFLLSFELIAEILNI